MANEQVEFDVVVNGKPAKKSLQDVKKELDTLEKQDKKTTKSMKTSWVAVGASVAGVATIMTKAVMSALALEKATFGLTRATKEYIKQASIQHGLSQEIIAGFIQTGKAAGMSGKEIETMIDQAVALKRAFPHESVDTFVDNLTMLNRTGEAQGFIVDVLETKYGTLDLKTLSLSEKMKAVEEVTRGINKEYGDMTASKVDGKIQKISNAFSSLGGQIIKVAEKTGILTFIQNTINAAQDMAHFFSIGLQSIGGGFIYMKAVAQNAISDILWAMRDIPGIGDTLKEKALAMNTEYNITIDRFRQIKKGLKDQVIEYKNLKKAQSETSITGIGGTTTPASQTAIEAEMKRLANLKKLRDAARAKELRAEKEHIKMLEQFDDDYLRSLTDGNEFELVKLSEQYNAYAQHVTDKARLDEWYNNEVTKLLEDNEEQTKAFGEMQEAVVNGMTNAMVDFAMTGKTSFKDMANSIIADLLRIQIQKAVVGVFGGADSTGILGGLLGLHTGGSVGRGSTIPSYHDGMRSDERLAKLQVGESVVNRAGTANNAGAIDAMNRGQTVGDGGGNITTADIKFEVTAIDAVSFDNYLVNNRKTIENIINTSLQQNGSVRQTIKAVV